MKQSSSQTSNFHGYIKCNVLPVNTIMNCISKDKCLQESVTPKILLGPKREKPVYTELENYC